MAHVIPSDYRVALEALNLLGEQRLVARAAERRDAPFRMPVQWVNRPNQDFRGFSGTLASGTVKPGERVRLHVEEQDRLQKNGSTPIARDGVLVESNLRENRAVSGFVQNRFLFGRLTVTPGVRIEDIHFERTNRLSSVTGPKYRAATCSPSARSLRRGSERLHLLF